MEQLTSKQDFYSTSTTAYVTPEKPSHSGKKMIPDYALHIWGMKHFSDYYERLTFAPYIRHKQTGKFVSVSTAHGVLLRAARWERAWAIKEKLLMPESVTEIFKRIGTRDEWEELMEEQSERWGVPREYLVW